MSNTRFGFLEPLHEETPYQLLYIASSRFENDWPSIKHAHACAELFFCVSGSGRFLIQDMTLNVRANDLIVINANVDHTEQSVTDDPLEYTVVGVAGLEFQHEGAYGYAAMDFGPVRESILFLLKTLISEVNTRGEHYMGICHHVLATLLLQLERLSDVRVSGVDEAAARPINKNAAWVRQYIDEHYAEDLTLTSLAELVRMNKYSLGHLFRKEYGTSPINYLAERRIREGKYLLEHSDHSISQIADILNFSSLSYFSQRFRHMEGISPKEFRERLANRG